MLATPLLKTPLSCQVDAQPSVTPKLNHPSRLKINLAKYLTQVWEISKAKNQSLSLISAEIDLKSPQSSFEIDKLTNIMRSIIHHADDFVGLASENKVVMVLPQTDLGEALQILYRLQDYYDGNLLKLEIFSTIAEETALIPPFISQLTVNSTELN